MEKSRLKKIKKITNNIIGLVFLFLAVSVLILTLI